MHFSLQVFLCLAILASSLLRSRPAHAQDWPAAFDSRVGLNVRTYPVGAQAIGAFGVNHLLWSKAEDKKSAWKYGYLRGGINLATSAVVNRAGFEFQFFPVSILGFTAGYDWGIRNFTPKWGVNCGVYECNGRIDRKFLRANLFAGYRAFVFSGMIRYEELRAFHTSKPFFDEMTLLVGRNSGEKILTLNPALLYTIDDVWKVGATSLYSHAVDTGDYSHLVGPIVTWTNESRLNIVAGLGLNRSPVVHSALSGFAVVSYALTPSLSITDLALRNAQAEKNGQNKPIPDVSESPTR